MRNFRRQRGYLIQENPSGKPIELDTFTCAHCNRIVNVPGVTNPLDLGGGCHICGGLICRHCVDAGRRGKTCTPFEKRLEEIERKDRFRREAGLIG